LGRGNQKKRSGVVNEPLYADHLNIYHYQRGIWGMENLDLSKLVAEKVYEFLFVYAPLKMKGATGSPGNPVAIY